MKAATWFVGWKNRNTFVFKAPSGYETQLTGSRASIETELLKLLPAWRAVARKQGQGELAFALYKANKLILDGGST